MPGNSFIKFTNASGDTIKGESLQASHPASKGWLEVSDWSWDIEAETNFLKGTGAAVGVATPGVFQFTHTFDKSSPAIMKNIVLGTAFKTVVVHMLKSTGKSDGQPEVYFGIKCSDVFVTKVSSKGGEDGGISQDVEFVFKAIALGYKQQGEKDAKDPGALSKTIRPFGWNVATKEMGAGYVVALDASD